jgi:hypothetical protein
MTVEVVLTVIGPRIIVPVAEPLLRCGWRSELRYNVSIPTFARTILIDIWLCFIQYYSQPVVLSRNFRNLVVPLYPRRECVLGRWGGVSTRPGWSKTFSSIL